MPARSPPPRRYEYFGTSERLRLRLSGKLLCGRSPRFMAPWHLVGIYTSIVVFAVLTTIGNILDAVYYGDQVSKYCNGSYNNRAVCDASGPSFKFEIARAVIGIAFYGGVAVLSFLSL